MSATLTTPLAQLENLFDTINKSLFDGRLIRPVITISPDTTRGAYGWFTPAKIWNEGEDNHHEINICAEYLARPIIQVAETLIHEMVHLHCHFAGIKDTSNRGHYHNKRFAQECEKIGLHCQKMEKYGWASTSLSDELRAKLETLDLKQIDLHRVGSTAQKSTAQKKSSIKYVCPECGAIVRATKKVRILCADCNVPFIEE